MHLKPFLDFVPIYLSASIYTVIIMPLINNEASVLRSFFHSTKKKRIKKRKKGNAKFQVFSRVCFCSINNMQQWSQRKQLCLCVSASVLMHACARVKKCNRACSLFPVICKFFAQSLQIFRIFLKL